MIDHVGRIRRIADRIVVAYREHAPPRAVLLAGSAAEGTADQYADLDLIGYYDVIPSAEEIRAWRAALGVAGPGSRNPDVGWGGPFNLDGVECEAGGMKVAFVAAQVADVLAGRGADAVAHQKTAMGMLHGLPLIDDGLIAGWRAQLQEFPDELARAMAHHYMAVFPYWRHQEGMASRDAHLFEMQSLLNGAFHVLGILSAANRLYYTPFQFKRMRRHIASMDRRPSRLAERIESLFTVDRRRAAEELRRLVHESVEIADVTITGVDSSAVRRDLALGNGVHES